MNAVDDIPNCDFIMPGIVRKGDLILAISTSGTSPAMARKVREDIETFLTDEDAALLDLAAEIRRELREQGIAVKACEPLPAQQQRRLERGAGRRSQEAAEGRRPRRREGPRPEPAALAVRPARGGRTR